MSGIDFSVDESIDSSRIDRLRGKKLLCAYIHNMTSSSSCDLISGESILTRDLTSGESNRLCLLTIRLDSGVLDMDE